jgi:hypothetical protein
MRDDGNDGRPPAAIGDGTGEPDDLTGDGAVDLRADREAGDAACWLPLVCPECGELGGHRPGCSVAAGTAGEERPPR